MSVQLNSHIKTFLPLSFVLFFFFADSDRRHAMLLTVTHHRRLIPLQLNTQHYLITMAMPNTLLHNTSPLPLDINIRPAVSLTGPTTIRLPLVVTAVTTPPATPKLGPATVTPKVSPPTTPILQPVSEVLCHSPDSQYGDADQDVAIWVTIIISFLLLLQAFRLIFALWILTYWYLNLTFAVPTLSIASPH